MASPGRQGRLKRLLTYDWDAVAGIVAAVVALVMHLLHLIDETILLVIAVVLLALRSLRDLRREGQTDRAGENVERLVNDISRLNAALTPPDVVLIGPRRLQAESEAFSRRATGDMVWFHVCLLMFKPQALFDTLLRPAVENPLVTSIQFVLDAQQQPIWDREVVPKVTACSGAAKVRPPVWTTIEENVSVILSETAPESGVRCLLSFWGEPFMSRSSGRDVPRYVFLVQPHSDLVPHFTDLIRRYQLSSR